MRQPIPIQNGQRFNRFTVLDTNNGREIICRCDCGTVKRVKKSNLVHGTKSCGCLLKELSQPFGYRFRYPELYLKYKGAKGRCNNPSVIGYKYYGGRGIKFLFTGGFTLFADYCIAQGWKPGLQIDRIDNNGNYEPGNIRFVSCRTNQRNRRVSKMLTAFGETKHIMEWIDDPRCIISYHTICSRLLNKWPVEKALTVPKHHHLKYS